MHNAKPDMPQEKYYKFSQYLKTRFGCRVYKIGIDAGFSCPNRDGKLSDQGCVYCDNRAFSLNSRRDLNSGKSFPNTIERQIEQGILFGRRRYAAQKFMVYFQSYTNTYAALDTLKQRYDVARKFKDVAAITIGTRPDCINEEILDLIQGYTQDYEVWLEYGLQSIHAKTLELVNRGHVYEDFLRAIELTRQRKNIKICAHVIIGLPNETREDIMATARALSRIDLDGIKIHPLHIIKGTRLEEAFRAGSCKLLGLKEYVKLVIEFLEYIPASFIIQRLTADCPRQFLAGPLWLLEKNKVLEQIQAVFETQEKYQGRLCQKVDKLV